MEYMHSLIDASKSWAKLKAFYIIFLTLSRMYLAAFIQQLCLT